MSGTVGTELNLDINVLGLVCKVSYLNSQKKQISGIRTWEPELMSGTVGKELNLGLILLAWFARFLM